MKKVYFPIRLFSILLFCFISHSAFAQYYMEITDGPLGGTKMEIGISNYMIYCEMPIGTEQYAELCNPIFGANLSNPSGPADVNLTAGCVGVCTRGGGIAFDLKSENIYTSGGKAMIIINNDQANPDHEMLFGTESPDPSFWSICLSFNNGEKIFESGVSSFKFKILAVQDIDIDDVIWDDGQFSGGIGSWSTVGISCAGAGQNANQAVWEYNEDGSTSGGGSSQSTIASPTACNGAMVFNSYFYDTNGGLAGDGPCWSTQIGELISPDIDLSALPAGSPVTLTFFQSLSHLNSEYFVAWSNDGGITWEQKTINEDLEEGEYITGEKKRVRLDGALPSSNFKVKFIYNGNYKFWIIDDVKLVKAAQFNLSTDNSWLSTAPYPMVPLSQIVPIQFMANVRNVGTEAMTGITLSASIYNDSNEEVYTYNTSVNSPGQNFGTLLGGDSAENIIFGSYLPGAVGDYKLVYHVTSNEDDADISDNTVTRTFSVTPDYNGEWGREDGITGSISKLFGPDEKIDWAYSNVFRGERGGSKITNVKFQVANADEIAAISGTAEFCIYECLDKNGDFKYTSDEFEVVGFNYYDFPPGSSPNEELTMPILDFSTNKLKNVVVKEGRIYILSLVYQAPEASSNIPLYWACSDKVDQRTTEFIGLTFDDYVCTHVIHSPWEVYNEINCSPDREVFDNTPVPYARFIVQSSPSSINQLRQESMNVYPTLASSHITVEFNKITNDAILQVTDVTGMVLLTNKFGQKEDIKHTISLEQFKAGTYFAKITTPDGIVTKPFIVIK